MTSQYVKGCNEQLCTIIIIDYLIYFFFQQNMLIPSTLSSNLEMSKGIEKTRTIFFRTTELPSSLFYKVRIVRCALSRDAKIKDGE